jgi:hypothetical protein
VNATPLKATVLVAGFVIVKSSVVVPFSGILAAPNPLEMLGGATTITVFVQSLLLSLLSFTTVFGSTRQTLLPPLVGLTREPAVSGVTLNEALKEAPAGKVTVPPLAVHVSVLLEIEQLIVPVPPGGVAPFVTVTAP